MILDSTATSLSQEQHFWRQHRSIRSLFEFEGMLVPAPLSSPSAEVLRALLNGSTSSGVVGRGNSSQVHACQADPYYVIKTVKQEEITAWKRELGRLRRLPALSVRSTVFVTNGPRALLPRLWPVPRGALRPQDVVRLNFDISAVLEMLHRAQNSARGCTCWHIMIRSSPACFVLIDYAGCSGDSVLLDQANVYIQLTARKKTYVMIRCCIATRSESWGSGPLPRSTRRTRVHVPNIVSKVTRVFLNPKP